MMNEMTSLVGMFEARTPRIPIITGNAVTAM